MVDVIEKKPKATVSPQERIAARKAELLAQVDRELQARAEATIAGASFDATPLRDARAEIEALDAALAELVRRDRAAESDKADGQHREAKQKAIAQLADWVTRLDHVEAAARLMVDELIGAERVRAELQALLQRLGHNPTLLMAPDQDHRRSIHLSALLNDMTKTSWFGEVELHVGYANAQDAWNTFERQLAANLTKQLKE